MFNKHERAGLPAETITSSAAGKRLKVKAEQVLIEEEILTAAGLEPLD